MTTNRRGESRSSTMLSTDSTKKRPCNAKFLLFLRKIQDFWANLGALGWFPLHHRSNDDGCCDG